jgi:hypothetical protein
MIQKRKMKKAINQYGVLNNGANDEGMTFLPPCSLSNYIFLNSGPKGK